MFGKKKIEPPKPQEHKDKAKGGVNSNIDYVGFKHGDPSTAVGSDKNKIYGISAQERVHMAIFGLPGSGKTSILKLLTLQNIKRNEGFMIIDPHGSYARDVMRMVPKSRWDDVIYVNPATIYKYGRTVQVNPLEINDPNERYVVVMSFVSALYNLYKDSWGPRLETVLRNAANALVESKDQNRLGNISGLITDADVRDSILEGVSSRNVVHFWKEIFEKQYSKDAGSSAYNKMDKILATPSVAAMFDAVKSSISIRDIMENRRMLIVDLSTGASDDIAEFLGSIFLNILYVDAKKRLDLEGEESAAGNRFYVYVDEAHMFSNSTMSEMLRSLRKFNVKMTLATQTCNAYDKDFAGEIPGVCKTIIAGRVDYNTANLIKSVMSSSTEELQRLPAHSFAMFSDEHGVHANATFRSRPIPSSMKGLPKWEEVAEHSLKKWGKQVSMETYMPVASKLLFTPLETIIIHMMKIDVRNWYRDEIMMRVKTIFPTILERNVSSAIDKLCRERYLTIKYPKTGDGADIPQKSYILGEKIHNTYLSKAYGGRRAGSEEHMELIFKIAKINRNLHRYCVPDLGDKGDEAPDLLIVEPDILTDKFGNQTYDPFKWSERCRLGVEVETEPAKHTDQVLKNYEKNAIRAKQDVWFVCFEERQVAVVENTIRDKYPKLEKCKIDVIDYEKVAKGKISIPDTYNESFNNLKMMSMNEINKMLSEGKDLKSAYLPKHNPTSSKDIPDRYNQTAGSDHTDTDRKYTDMKGKRPKRMAGGTELEWKIKEHVVKNFGVRYDAESIRGEIGGTSLNVVKEAINSLLKKKILHVVEREMIKKTSSIDTQGEQRESKKVKFLEVVMEDIPENDDAEDIPENDDIDDPAKVANNDAVSTKNVDAEIETISPENDDIHDVDGVNEVSKDDTEHDSNNDTKVLDPALAMGDHSVTRPKDDNIQVILPENGRSTVEEPDSHTPKPQDAGESDVIPFDEFSYEALLAMVNDPRHKKHQSAIKDAIKRKEKAGKM